MKRMLDDRNPLLAAAIDACTAAARAVFAAVGSLHMIGPTGLPALLRQRGYRVEQVRLRALTAARSGRARSGDNRPRRRTARRRR